MIERETRRKGGSMCMYVYVVCSEMYTFTFSYMKKPDISHSSIKWLTMSQNKSPSISVIENE